MTTTTAHFLRHGEPADHAPGAPPEQLVRRKGESASFTRLPAQRERPRSLILQGRTPL